jgi:hypothetical protein
MILPAHRDITAPLALTLILQPDLMLQQRRDAVRRAAPRHQPASTCHT